MATWGDWKTLGSPMLARGFGKEVLYDYSPGGSLNRVAYMKDDKSRGLPVLDHDAGPLSRPLPKGKYTLADTVVRAPVLVDDAGALRGRTIVAMASCTDSIEFNYKLALCSDGTLVTWGVPGTLCPPVNLIPRPTGPKTVSGSYGLPSRDYLLPTPVPRKPGQKITAIATGAGATMALTDQGEVYEWGLHTGFPLFLLPFDDDTFLKVERISKSHQGRFFDHFTPRYPEGITLLMLADDLDALVRYNSLLRSPLQAASAEDNPVHVDFGAMKGRKAVAISYDESGDAVVLCADGALVSWGSVLKFDQDTIGLGLPTVINNGGVFQGKKITAVAGHTVLCSDGTLIRWPTPIDGEVKAFIPKDPEHLLEGRTIAKITPGFLLFTDGKVAALNIRTGGMATNTPVQHDMTYYYGIDDEIAPFDPPLLHDQKVADIAADTASGTVLCADGRVAELWLPSSYWVDVAGGPRMPRGFNPPSDPLQWHVTWLNTSCIPAGKVVVAVAPQMLLFGDRPAK